MLTYTKKLKSIIEAEVEILTPLHISSGKSYQPSDVVRDPESFFVINERKLIEKFADNTEVLNELENPRLILQKFFEEHEDLYVDDYMLYELEARTRKTARYGMPLNSFARKGADFVPYIPGSSMKGTLLSGILWDLNQIARGDTEKWSSDIFVSALKRCMQRRNEMNINDNEFIGAILGKDSSNFTQKAFRILDADLKPDDIGVFATAMFHCDRPNGSGYHWTGIQKQPTTDFTKISYELIEAIKPGTKFKVKIIVDNVALRNVKFGELGKKLRDGKPYEFGDVASAIFELAFNTLYYEKEFYSKTGHRKLINVSEDLYNYASSIAEDPESNEILFRLGWGMNYHGVTGFLWQDDIVKKLRLPMQNYQEYPYPKSRRIVFDGQNEVGTPGWVKMRINF
ncbi:MAG: type III-A CRISPR-associated RAMP protein Csm5 [Planctomycetes bacterium]|nr:type III-A CRISPR-associated RAMP protein Csm5 [Planctomycetota bacterium]